MTQTTQIFDSSVLLLFKYPIRGKKRKKKPKITPKNPQTNQNHKTPQNPQN